MTPRQRFLAARWAYVGVVLIATLTQLDFSPDLAAAAQRLARAFTISLGWADAIDGLRNVTLFAGLGAVWVVTTLSGRIGEAIRQATLVGLLLSATVEGLQVFSPVRTASLVDVTTNTLGALGGAVLLAQVIARVQHAKGARSYLGIPAALVVGGYGVAVACEALTPLFHSEQMASIEGGPLARLRLALAFAFPLTLDEVPLLDILLFAPAAFLVVLLLKESGGHARRTWWLVPGAGAVLAFGLELVHGLYGLSIRWEAAATHALALSIGAWAADRWLAPLTQALRGAVRARAAVFAYGALLVLWGWRPLLPETDGEAILAQFSIVRLTPLASLAVRADVFSALHVAQQFLLYLPLGSMLAVWPLRLEGRWSHLWPGCWLAVAIELGHILIVGRYFDVTNVMISVAGLGIGWIVVRRSGFTPYGAALPSGATAAR
jgi:glycopeptide antibiotics resistance protein